MPNYVIAVEKTVIVKVEVRAKNDQEAFAEAERSARNSFHPTTYAPPVTKAKSILFVTPDGEPAVKLPSSWEIYSSVRGSEKVNAKITEAVTKVKNEILKLHKAKKDVGALALNALTKRHISPVLDRYERYGTHDTEPRAAIRHYLCRIVSKLTDADFGSLCDNFCL